MSEKFEYGVGGMEEDDVDVVITFGSSEEARAWLAGPRGGWARSEGAVIVRRRVSDWERVPAEGERA